MIRIAGAVFALSASAALACPAPGTAIDLISETPGAPVAYADMAPPPLSAPFTITIGFCGLEAGQAEHLDFDAVMPAHQHGMNFRVDVTPRGKNQFDVSNVVFHMPGQWELLLDVEINGQTYGYTAEVTLE